MRCLFHRPPVLSHRAFLNQRGHQKKVWILEGTMRIINTIGIALLTALPAQAQSGVGAAAVKPPDRPPGVTDPGGFCPQGNTDLCIPLDGSFTPVDMNQPGGSGPADPGDFCQRNDDDSGLVMLDGWSFTHFGTDYSEVYINNNGNLSFGQAFSTFTPSGFPVSGFPMVAPFWADVDTGDILDTFGGVAWVRQESVAAGDAVNRLTVIWDHVGYYDEHGDKLCTFEVIISDGFDPLLGPGNNVCFCYDDMQWTTGDASSGIGGFGGSPATVGANEGNGVDFFQIGLFDHEGTDYDGPGGNVDGVSFLDNSTVCFNLSGSTGNIPPVFINPPLDCLFVQAGNQLPFTIQATGPELGETVTMSVDAGGLANFSFSVTPGNPAVATCMFTPDVSQIGTHNVTFTATDDGVPPASTQLTICLEVGCSTGGNYCVAGVNSDGQSASIGMQGSTSIAANDLMLVATGVADVSVAGLFVMGDTPMQAPFLDGFMCVDTGGLFFRINPVINVPGDVVTRQIDYNAMPTVILAGSTWNFQYWYRDVPYHTNLTDGLSLCFIP